MKQTLVALVLMSFFMVAGWQVFIRENRLTYFGFENLSERSLALSFQEVVKTKDLADRYRMGELKILIVPGHDNQYSGASYRGYREADFNIELARYLSEVLAVNNKFEVYVARDLLTGFYQEDIAELFDKAQESILNFKTSKKSLMAELLANGLVDNRSTDNHSFATNEIAYRLYGINKWVNDNDIDLVIHIHFNDYPGHKDGPGKYEGITVYTPDEQYPNGEAGISVGRSVFEALSQIRPTSNNPLELAGVVPDQELIAIGSNASVNAAAILIEYGYIYEPEFQTAVEREKIFKAMAEKTYEGLVNYLD